MQGGGYHWDRLLDREAVVLLRALRGICLVGCDVVEVSPSYEGPGQPTALAAANALGELLGLGAVASSGSSSRV